MPPRNFETEPATQTELNAARKNYKSHLRRGQWGVKFFTYLGMGQLVGVSEGHAMSLTDGSMMLKAAGSIALLEGGMEIMNRRRAATASEERLIDFIPAPEASV